MYRRLDVDKHHSKYSDLGADLRFHRAKATTKEVIRLTTTLVQETEVGMHNSTVASGWDRQYQTLRFTLGMITLRDTIQKELDSNRSSTTQGITRDQRTRQAMDMDRFLDGSMLHNQDGDLTQMNFQRKNWDMIQMPRLKTC